jgi:hypothetical protein
MKYTPLVVLLMSGMLLLGFLWLNIPVVSGYIKITSPYTGQHVPLGNIVIDGTSFSNSTLHCIVSIVLNGVQPYKNAIPLGQHEGGANGYSNWTFTSSITKPGLNKITAKFSCPPTLHLTKFYSVNVTASETLDKKAKKLGTLTNSTTFGGLRALFPGVRKP